MMFRRYYTNVSKYELAKLSKQCRNRNNEDSGEDDRIQVTFQLWHRSFELLNIPFMFRFSAALFSIFRYLQPAGAILPNQMSV